MSMPSVLVYEVMLDRRETLLFPALIFVRSPLALWVRTYTGSCRGHNSFGMHTGIQPPVCCLF